MARTYIPLPDFHKHPTLFIECEDRPFEGDTLLRNRLWVRKERYHPKGLPFSVIEAGADPSGCAATVGRAKTKKAAILLALDLKPLEPPTQKRERIEARARGGMDPAIVHCLDELFGNCWNALGAPLDEEARGRLTGYFLEPTVERWEDIYSLILSPRGMINTVWQFWCELSTAAPRIGPSHNADGHMDEWDLIPTPLEVLCVLREAAHRNERTAIPTKEKND